MDSNNTLLFSQRNKYLLVISATLLPIVSLLLFVFLTSYRPVFYSLEDIVDRELNAIHPVHKLQTTLLHTIMPPNDFLIHGSIDEKLKWELGKKEVEQAFKNVFDSKILNPEYDTLISLKEQWNVASRQGDMLFEVDRNAEDCNRHPMANAMEHFDESITRITFQLGMLTHKMDHDIHASYAQIGTLKKRGLLITVTAILLGMAFGVAGSVWMSRERKKIVDLSLHDTLTGVFNRQALNTHLETTRRDHAEGRIPYFSILMIDIDNFKQINDRHGHDAGDTVLKKFVGEARNIVRENDVFGRFGGEEFLVVLPGASKIAANSLAERIRDRISCMEVELPGQSGTMHMTVSIGAATFPDDSSEIEGVIKAADTAMYQAKNSGKNRVVCS